MSETPEHVLIKKLKSKIVSHKTAFMIDTDDAISLMVLVEQQQERNRHLQGMFNSSNKSAQMYYNRIMEKEKELQQLIKIEEDYKALVQIMDRARKLAFLIESEDKEQPLFKMDENGNLTRINES